MSTTPDWNDLKAAGEVPPPSSEVLAHARGELELARIRSGRRTSTRRWMAPAVAAAGVGAAVVGAVAVYQIPSSTIPVTGPSAQTSRAGSSATPSTPSQGVAASCVSGYTPAELRKRAFAFDGTVLTIVRDPAGPIPSYLVTLQVNEWFKPTDGALRVTVRTYNPPQGSSNRVSIDFPDYTVGTRLLIAGEPQWGGTNPLKDAIAWGCGFSRAYNAADAVTWRKILSK
jgi:hypothetical protein